MIAAMDRVSSKYNKLDFIPALPSFFQRYKNRYTKRPAMMGIKKALIKQPIPKRMPKIMYNLAGAIPTKSVK